MTSFPLIPASGVLPSNSGEINSSLASKQSKSTALKGSRDLTQVISNTISDAQTRSIDGTIETLSTTHQIYELNNDEMINKMTTLANDEIKNLDKKISEHRKAVIKMVLVSILAVVVAVGLIFGTLPVALFVASTTLMVSLIFCAAFGSAALSSLASFIFSKLASGYEEDRKIYEAEKSKLSIDAATIMTDSNFLTHIREQKTKINDINDLQQCIEDYKANKARYN